MKPPQQNPSSPLPQESEEIGQTLFEDVADGALLIIQHDGKIRRVNEKAVEIIGHNQLLDKQFSEVVILKKYDGQVLEKKDHPLYRTLSEGYKQLQPFFCLLEKEGKAETMVLKVLTIRSSAKNSQGAIVQLRPAKRQLDLKDMQNNFISLAAHQLKTPAGVTQGFLELALETLPQKAYFQVVRQQLVKAYEANQKLVRVAKNLLNATKIQGGLLEPDIRPFIVEDIISNKFHTYNMWAKNKKINLQFGSSGLSGKTLHSDPMLVSELLDILLNNALKFTPSGGKVSVNAKLTESNFETTVHDTGPGITGKTKSDSPAPQGENEALFGASSGHGLGLRLASQYALLLKGELLYESPKEGGAKFTLRLPDWK